MGTDVGGNVRPAPDLVGPPGLDFGGIVASGPGPVPRRTAIAERSAGAAEPVPVTATEGTPCRCVLALPC